MVKSFCFSSVCEQASRNVSLIVLMLLLLITSSIGPDPDYQPLIELGHVDLSEYAECEEKMSDHLTTCQEKYHEKVRNKINEMNGNMRTESVKRSICCGAWSAKKCVADASERIDQCPVNITEQYRALPSDIKVKDHVFDKCSEYQEGSAICYEDGHHSHWFNLHSLATILVSIFVVSVVIVALVAIYQRK